MQSTRFAAGCWRIGVIALLAAFLLEPPAQAQVLPQAQPRTQTVLITRASGLAAAGLASASPAAQCTEAVHAAELRHRLPPGLLFAISQVESGRPDAGTHRVLPWPWTVQAEDKGLYFDSKQQAVQWVRDAMARGVASIDTGCLQVNLFYHPQAFNTIDDAFDPRLNAEYAARFLLQLYAATGDWRQATGFYHSQTAALAQPYEAQVERTLGGPTAGWPIPGWTSPPKPVTVLAKLADAWRATYADEHADPAPLPVGQGLVGQGFGHDWSSLLRGPVLRGAGHPPDRRPVLSKTALNDRSMRLSEQTRLR